ncbi:hypothetical protein DUD99_16125 [Salmonella enterica subsp. enterica]|nr:hypothetical protein [Salmonella enterica]EAC2143749.1 hypothetical protein [Salmonella enterica subsp. enterica]EDW0652915.1 hypothetical protein [Salmonella enterica subsp. enterica serovar Weslaco]EAQ6073398.1 hypothetical protein [Salmonella enterica]EAW1858146.1 hypothetical protein [Salmonella enterica subsp. enterica]
MGWKYKEIIIPEKPLRPSFMRWGVFLVMSVGFCMALFILHATERLPLLKFWNIWLLSCFPLMLFLLGASLQSYIFGVKLRQWTLLTMEAARIDDEWRQWANRYISIVGRCVIFPDKMTAPFLFHHADKVEAQWGLAKRIDYLPESHGLIEQAIRSLLHGIKNAVNTLPVKAELHITVFTDFSRMQWEAIDALFPSIWDDIFPDRILPDTIRVTNEASCDKLERRLKTGEEYFELIMAMQLNGEGKYSDGLSVLLTGTDDMIQKYKINSIYKLLRPMPLNNENLEKDFSVFFKMQAMSCQAKNIIGDSKEVINFLPAIFSVGNKYKIQCKAENIKLLGMFSGLTGPYSDWMMIAFSVDVSELASAPSLIISSAGGWIGSVVYNEKKQTS